MKKLLIIISVLFLISFVLSAVPDPLGDYDSDDILNQDDNCYFVFYSIVNFCFQELTI